MGKEMRRDIRKGITKQEVNEQMLGFVITECLLFSGITTYAGVTYFGFHGIATFITVMLVSIVLSMTKVYSVLGVVFSIGWGFLGYKVFKWLIVYTGGGVVLSTVFGIFMFIVVFVLTIGARMLGQEYLDDIES